MYDRIKLDSAERVFEHSCLDPDYLFALKHLNARRSSNSPPKAKPANLPYSKMTRDRRTGILS